jgi:hypothetical protein
VSFSEEKTMLSRWLARVTGILLLCLAVAVTASAQYGGGGGTGGSGGTGSGGSGTGSYSSGNGKAIGIGVGVAAGAVVGIALLVHHHHAAERSQASVIGCTQTEANGISLKNENDDETYTILSASTPLRLGERVELKGTSTADASGTHVFRVSSLVKSYGMCGTASAVMEKSAGEKN